MELRGDLEVDLISELDRIGAMKEDVVLYEGSISHDFWGDRNGDWCRTS